jgi:quercetin 2,3-dioxygenase
MNTRRKFLLGVSAVTLAWLTKIKIAAAKGKVMYQIRRSNERGYADHGWLKSHHTFSFAGYYDPNHMAFSNLRVINEDYIAGGRGFGAHPHRDMEIITYVVKGSLQHEDSMGTKAIIRPGEVQRMTAGTGVVHSEFNAQKDEEVHLFQIWIMPKEEGVKPGYGQKSFERELNSKKLVHVVSRDGRDGSIGINQDADMYISRLKASDSLDFKVQAGRGLWIQVVKGQIKVGGDVLYTGDALSTQEAQLLNFEAAEDAELIIFDLAS